ncbi:hypothetical protein, partial [uncultured Legionella sp.]|uniref:hypothetical protein n=1 Tax=uncultured Legionella sp. TaxID=210934 RepID=UPI002631992E
MQRGKAIKILIKTLKPFFKSYNYLKNGNSFYCLKEENCGLIAFQKSTKSIDDQTSITELCNDVTDHL